MKQTLKHFVAALVAMFAVVSAYAQVTTSSLGGRVVDSADEAIAGVAVIATHEPSGSVYHAVTNENGRYAIQGMRSGGPYKVEFSCLGYQTVINTDVTLQLAEQYGLNAVMPEDKEMLSEALVIAQAASMFAGEKTGAATNISNEQMMSMPTISRSITDVMRLSPYAGNDMNIAGMDGRSANFTVDGANFNNNFGLSDGLPGGGSPISLDAIEEMQVVVSPYDVRQTNFIGGGTNAITKSGTNQVKGTAYTYYENEKFRGNKINGVDLGPRAVDRNTVYGFTLGGPIVKNKLFFFVNFEYAKTPTEVNLWRPSEDGEWNEDLKISRTTKEDMQRVKDHLMTKYGYDPGSYTEYPANESNRKFLARIDWNINENHKLAVRYNSTLNRGWKNTNASSSNCGQRTTQGRLSKYSMAFANSLYSMDNKVNSIAFDLNSRLSDNLSNQFLVTYTQSDDIRGSSSEKFPFIDILDGTGTITPYISAGYELFTWNNGVHNTTMTIKDDLTYYYGDHKITAGASFEYQMADNAYMRNGTGYYRYNSLNDFLTGAAPETVAITYGYKNSEDPENPAARVRFNQVGAYAQDEWNMTDNFKLNYGLRVDAIKYNEKDIMRNQKAYDLDYNGRHIDTGVWPATNLQFSPRVGFSWNVFGNNSFKLRGGTGLFAGRIPLVFFTNMPTNSGMVQNVAAVTTTYGSNGVVDPLLQHFAGDMITDVNELVAKLNKLDPQRFPLEITPEMGALPSEIQAVDPKFKMPQIWKTSIAFDWQLPTSFPFTITGEYIYNKTINDIYLTNWNIADNAGWSTYNGPDNRHIYPANYKYTDVDAFVLSNTNKGYGYSASVTVKMQPTKRLNLIAAYTRTDQRQMSSMPGSSASSAYTYTPTVEGPNFCTLQPTEYVTPHRGFISASYSIWNMNFNLFYEAYRAGRYSYMYANDFNGDNYNYDLIYVPNSKDEVKFVSEDDAERFWNFVENDEYLKTRKGKYAEGNSVYSPWAHSIDFHFDYNLKVKVSGQTNTLQFNIDVQNLANLFNDSWGVAKQMNPALNSGRILTFDHVDDAGVPVFKTNAAIKPDMQLWTPISSIYQCWSFKVGIKYMFN